MSSFYNLFIIISFLLGYLCYSVPFLISQKRTEVIQTTAISGLLLLICYNIENYNQIIISSLIGFVVSFVNLELLEKKLKEEEKKEDSKKTAYNPERSVDEKELSIEIPNKKKYLVGESFLRDMPVLFERTVEFSLLVSELLDNEIKKKKKVKSEEDVKIFLFEISTIFFKTYLNKENNFRIHWRYYDVCSNSYECLSVYLSPPENNQKYGVLSRSMKKNLSKINEIYDINRKITPIPAEEESTIKESAILNNSLIMSFNPEYHFRTKNTPEFWKDYITFSYGPKYRNDNEATNDRFGVNNNPLLSFTISTSKQGESIKNKFIFLSYINFEKIIGKYISYYSDNITSIKEVLSGRKH